MKLMMWSIYPIGFLIKRDKSIWLFGSYSGFTDNSRYLFESTTKKNDVRCIWISDDIKLIKKIRCKGYETYYKYSVKGIYFCYIAKVYIYSNYVSTINFYTSAGAVLVNLWHGTPLKKIEYDISKSPLFNYFKGASFIIKILMPEKHKKCNFILAPSQFVYDYSFKSAFRVYDMQYAIIADPPRISNLLSRAYHKVNNDKNSIKKTKKTFLYAPTWRDDRSDFISISGLNFNEINNFLLKNNAYLQIRLHPNTTLNIDMSEMENIHIVDNYEPAEDSMLNSDFLITDYSSIYFDYLYLNRPIIFFPFDLEKYTASRDFYLSYNEATPGVKVYNQGELIQEMDNLLKGIDNWMNYRKELAEKFCSLERRNDDYIIKKIKKGVSE